MLNCLVEGGVAGYLPERITENPMHMNQIRPLKIQDAPRMLEWMHDKETAACFFKDFSKLTEEDCIRFIQDSYTDNSNVHMAAVTADDVYAGTVSLKQIDRKHSAAEFAIAMHMDARGKGIATIAMREIIRYGQDVLQLKYIYWNVLQSNARAVSFYDRNGYRRAEESRIQEILGGEVQLPNHTPIYWYFV